MSNRMTLAAAGSNSSVQPVAASLRLGCGIDDLEFEAGLLGDAAAKLLAILRGAASRRGDEPCAHDAANPYLVATDRERFDRARNGGLADAARRGDAFAKANDPGEGIDDAEAVRGRSRDQQAAIIGAEIERGIGPRMMLVRRAPVVAMGIATDAVWRSATPASTPRRTLARGPSTRTMAAEAA